MKDRDSDIVIIMVQEVVVLMRIHLTQALTSPGAVSSTWGGWEREEHREG